MRVGAIVGMVDRVLGACVIPIAVHAGWVSTPPHQPAAPAGTLDHTQTAPDGSDALRCVARTAPRCCTVTNGIVFGSRRCSVAPALKRNVA